MRKVLLVSAAFWILIGVVSAGEPRVLFEDTFDSKLGDGWTWLRENPEAWRFGEQGLEIRVEPGVAPTVKNALVREAPDRSKVPFAVEVTITFTAAPTQQFEQGGITWYHEGKPVFKLVHEHIDGKEWIIPGKKPASGITVQLRLIVAGNRWTAQYREDPKDQFQAAGSGELPPPGRDQVSIQCYNGPSDAAHWIRFENFRIVELRE